MLKGDRLRKADIITGSILVLLGCLVIYGATGMPMGGTYGGVDNPWYASPAAFPFFLGGLLAIGGAIVAVKGFRSVGARDLGAFVGRVLKTPAKSDTARRGSIVVAVLGCYYLLLRLQLFGTANYVVSSAIFLAGMALIFYRPSGTRPRLNMIILICLGATIVSVSVAALFSGPLRVPLP